MSIELIGNVALILFFSVIAVITLYLGLKEYNDSNPIKRMHAKQWMAMGILSIVLVLMALADILS